VFNKAGAYHRIAASKHFPLSTRPRPLPKALGGLKGGVPIPYTHADENYFKGVFGGSKPQMVVLDLLMVVLMKDVVLARNWSF
jgi:hypothetical protein